MANYEFFKKEFEFRGRHARMADEMCFLNDYEHTYFKRVIDLYVVAAVIGFRIDRKADMDYSPYESKSIFLEQMLKAKHDLDFIMQMVIMLEHVGKLPKEECVKKAFRGVETKEEFEYYQNLFNSYVRGGVEELYERLIQHSPKDEEEFYDDKIAALMGVLERFTPKEKILDKM